jgi:ribonuclease E
MVEPAEEQDDEERAADHAEGGEQVGADGEIRRGRRRRGRRGGRRRRGEAGFAPTPQEATTASDGGDDETPEAFRVIEPDAAPFAPPPAPVEQDFVAIEERQAAPQAVPEPELALEPAIASEPQPSRVEAAPAPVAGESSPWRSPPEQQPEREPERQDNLVRLDVERAPEPPPAPEPVVEEIDDRPKRRGWWRRGE